MAKTFVKVTMFYVEQGLAQTIEVFGSDEKLKALVLVDFGTDRYIWSYDTLRTQPTALGNSCDLLAGKAEERGCIDFLIISHTDNDHINLLVKFLQSRQIAVNKVLLGGTPRGRHSIDKFTGGTIEKQAGSKVLEDLGKLLAAIQPDPAAQTRFFASMNHYFIQKGDGLIPKAEEPTKLEEWSFDTSQPGKAKALLRVVTSRHFVDDAELSREAGAYVNANSVVLALEVYAGPGSAVPSSVIFLTGDIQWTTMRYLTDCFEKGGAACFPFLNAGVHRAMIVPHHGALKTACKGNSVKRDPVGSNPLEVQLADLKKWGKKMDCEILAVSAKAKGNRYHPCRQTMEQLNAGHLRTAPAAHQNLEMTAALTDRGKSICNYTKTVIPSEAQAVYTSYAGAVAPAGQTQETDTARSVIISVDENGNMDVAADERGGA